MKKILKNIYSLVPFKKELFFVVRKFFNPNEKIYKHLHFKGIFKLQVNRNCSFRIRHYGYQLENDLFWKGVTGRWEKKSIEIWIKLSEKAKVVLDIGANTGVYSLITKSLNSTARVMAFEPVERVFKRLEHNIWLNNYDIESYFVALSDQDGEGVFFDTESEHTYTVTLNKDMSQDSGYYPVKVKLTTIDQLAKDKKLDKIDLIKIDVETHEPEVLKGFSQIGKYQPAILIEILSDDIGSRVQKEIEHHGGGYLYFDIDEEKDIRQVDRIRKSSGMNYLLCTETTARELNLV